MNSFETDVKRAIISKGFLAGFVLELLILWKVGGDSELFRVTVPVISTFPYATAWLADYQSGYIKAYLPRCGRTSYICGKFLACGIAVGLYFLLKPYLGTETVSWVCILGAAPFAAIGFVKYNGMTAEKFVWAWFKSEFLMPKKLVFHSTNVYYELMKPSIEQKQKEVLKSND